MPASSRPSKKFWPAARPRFPRAPLYKFVLAEVDLLEAQPAISPKPVNQNQTTDAVHRNLSALTPVGRQAFLLVPTEEFSSAGRGACASA